MKIGLYFAFIYFFVSTTLAQSETLKLKLCDTSVCQILPDAINGNWFTDENFQDWKLGIYDSIIIYDLEVWKVSKIENCKKYFLCSIRNKKNHKRRIYLKLIKKGLMVGYSPDKFDLLYRNEKYEFRDVKEEVNTFDKLKFHPDTAYYEGYIEGNNSEDKRYGKIIINNNLLKKQESSLIEITQDGIFHAKVPLQYPQQVSILIPGYETSVFLTPGQKTLNYINLKDISKSLFMGTNQRINSELFNYPSYQYFLAFSRNGLPDTIPSMNPYEFKEFCLSYKEKQLSKAEQYADSLKISTESREFMVNTIEFVTYLNILSYNKCLSQYVDPINLDLEFYNFLDEKVISNQMTLSAASTFFLYLRLLSTIRRPPTLVYKYNKLYQLLNNNGEFRDSTKLKELIKCQTDEDITAFKKLDSTYWNNFDSKYNATIDSLLKTINYEKTIYFEDISLFNLNRFFGINNGLVKDIIQSMNISYAFEYLPEKNIEKLIKMIKSKISYEPFQTYLISYYTSLVDTILQKKNLAKFDLTYMQNENLIDSILIQNKGKLILIDFWATWCAPCIKNSRRFIEIKKNLNQNDYKFIYITNQSSPYNKWMSFADEFGGEHYRVDGNTWNILSTKFQISGIPHYVLYDKNGILIDNDFNINYENEKLIEILNNLK